MEDNNNNSQQTQYKKSYAREQYNKLVNNFVEWLEKERYVFLKIWCNYK